MQSRNIFVPHNAKEIVERDLGHLLYAHPNMVGACIKLKIFVTDCFNGRAVETAATDGRRLLVNPKFYFSLTRAQRRGLLLHECLHVECGHSYRIGTRNPDEWNQSCDHEINHIVIAENEELPANGLINKKFRMWSCERIHYELFTKKPQPPTTDPGDGRPGEDTGDGTDMGVDDFGVSSDDSPNNDDSQQQDTNDGDEGEETETETLGGEGDQPSSDDSDDDGSLSGGDGDIGALPKRETKESDEPPEFPTWDNSGQCGEVWAATDEDTGEQLTEEQCEEALGELAEDIARGESIGAGCEPGGALKASIECVRNPAAAWTRHVETWVTKVGKPIGTTYRKQHRRGLSLNLLIPGEIKSGIEFLICAADVSYSMDMPRLVALFENLDALRKRIRIEKIRIVPFATTILQSEIVEISRNEPLPTDFHIGGGTNYEPVMHYMRRYGQRADGLIVFTDLECWNYGNKPKCPVLWASSDPIDSGNRPPYGDAIEIDIVR